MSAMGDVYRDAAALIEGMNQYYSCAAIAEAVGSLFSGPFNELREVQYMLELYEDEYGPELSACISAECDHNAAKEIQFRVLMLCLMAAIVDSEVAIAE